MRRAWDRRIAAERQRERKRASSEWRAENKSKCESEAGDDGGEEHIDPRVASSSSPSQVSHDLPVRETAFFPPIPYIRVWTYIWVLLVSMYIPPCVYRYTVSGSKVARETERCGLVGYSGRRCISVVLLTSSSSFGDVCDVYCRREGETIKGGCYDWMEHFV